MKLTNEELTGLLEAALAENAKLREWCAQGSHVFDVKRCKKCDRYGPLEGFCCFFCGNDPTGSNQ